MNNDLSIFNYAEQNVRIVMIENEPWFVATDICNRLGLENVSRAVASIDKEDTIQCKVNDLVLFLLQIMILHFYILSLCKYIDSNNS